ncbi:GNAT family N-acetyltransferase [Undibacterium sp. TJN25]|uniref:GNAT family N-acetyltransferase n=1 Tax=Undibacterium sp. TJN25 TaxID=3413056 RepID=UPI003BF24E9C
MNKVCIYDSIVALPSGYKALFDRSERTGGIFSSLSWFQHLSKTSFEPGTHLRIYGLESETDTDNARGALVMRFQPQKSRWLTPYRLEAATNYYTSLFSPTIGGCDADMQDKVGALIRAIKEDTLHWDMVDMHPMALDAPIFQASVLAFRSAGMITQHYFCFGNWYLQVQGRTYGEYFSTLPSRLRNTVQRKSKQLESTDRLSISIFKNRENLNMAIQVFQKIYQSSWKGSESYPDFIHGLIELLADEGKLRLGIAYIDQQPAAAQIWIVSGGTASIYKLAYDEQFTSLSIGSILTARMMQQVIDGDKVSEVDYLTGDEAYKQDWMSHRRERWGILAFRTSSVRGLCAAILHIGGHTVKKLVKQLAYGGKRAIKLILGN